MTNNHRSKTRLLPLLVLLIVGSLVAAPVGHAIFDPYLLDLQDHAEEIEVVGGWCWRGYTFTVSQVVLVDTLYGGYRSGPGVFHVALYLAPALEMHDLPALALLSDGQIHTEGEPFQGVEIDPTLLVPGVTYLVAMGRETGFGSNFRVGPIDVDSIRADEPSILDWGPSDGRAYTFYCEGGPLHPTQTPASPTTSTVRPHLGFSGEALSPH